MHRHEPSTQATGDHAGNDMEVCVSAFTQTPTPGPRAAPWRVRDRVRDFWTLFHPSGGEHTGTGNLSVVCIDSQT